MGKEKNQFSPFKLFYNEIIYKNNSSVNYYNVDRNIIKIKEIVSTIRNTPTNNVNFYNTKLNRAKKRLKYHLGKIAEYNNDIYEYYYLLYKTKCHDSLESISDVPIILANSFGEDYKLTKDSNFDFNRVIPRFTSLEKKQIRDEAKKISSLEYFINLLKVSDYSFLYNNFFKKINLVFNIKPLYKENYNEFYKRTIKVIDELEHLYKRLERKAKYSSDYDLIKEQMEVAYKNKFDNWVYDIRRIIEDYLNKVYEETINDINLKEMFNKSNDITYQKYCELVDMLVNEKETLMDNFTNDNFVKVSSGDNSYTIRFKENLINNYFDIRYKNNLSVSSKVSDYVNRAVKLYDLASSLADEIFERIIFDSSHSSNLMRNNDVNSALLVKIYDLYNPMYLIGVYQKTKNEFDAMLAQQDNDFKDKYEKALNNYKLEYDYHGPIPNTEAIKLNILQRRKDFILEHCITDLKSIDIFYNYDTRNYDLYVIADGLKNDELISLYSDIKNKINNYSFTTINFFDKLIGKNEEVEKNILLKAAQEFIVKMIYNNLNIVLTNQNEINDKYRDICYGYLNEHILFLEDNSNESLVKEKYDEFLEARNKFKEVSKWANYIEN